MAILKPPKGSELGVVLYGERNLREGTLVFGKSLRT